MNGRPVVNERIARRRAEVRAARRRVRLRRTLTVLAVAMVVVAGVVVERSSLVALASIEVDGLQRLDEQVVRDAAGVELGTSVLRIRTGRVAERVTALPLVDAAEVSRDGALGLRIVVDEAAPALTAVYPSTTVLVSEQGLVLGEGDAPGTPRVEARGRPPAAGTRVDERPALATAHGVVLSLPGPIRALVERTRAVADDEVELVLEDGNVVRWGDEGRADEKARALGSVLEDLDGRVVTAIDVSAPGTPFLVP